MEMTDNNLCNSCINLGCEFQSGIVRTECAFYMPPHIEPDNCGNYVVMQPTVDAIPKDQYEARLKADMVAMLTDLQLEIEEKEFLESSCSFMDKTEEKNYAVYTDDISKAIQQKINALKGDQEGKQ